MGLYDIYQLMLNFFPGKAYYTEQHYPDLTGKVVLVTGANSGVGYEAARLLASKNAIVYTLARNEVVMQECIDRIKSEFPTAQLHPVIADLGNLPTIKPAAEKLLASISRLDIVIHNAGVMTPPKGTVSAQGYEIQLAVNNLAPYLLQTFLNPIMEQTANSLSGKQNTSRIVWVASSGTAIAPPTGVVIDKLNDVEADTFQTYAQSKAGNIIFASQWVAHNPNSKIISLTVDPGNLKSNLQRHTGWLGQLATKLLLYPPIYGAYSELFCALHPDTTTADNGRYAIPWGRWGWIRADIKESCNNEIGERFWDYCEEHTKAYK